jgi:predicted RNA-binding protein associated with RNAse of E/G family
MTRARPTASKRNVQQHKREKARAKQERRAARRIEDPLVDTIRIQATEEELIDELAALHRAVETATISPDEFESRREVIRLQLEQIARDIP